MAFSQSSNTEPLPTGLIGSKGIELLTFRTPNGHKASVLLEELKAAYGIEYTFQNINLMKGVNRQPWYTQINPMGKIPVIVDHDHDDFCLSESLAIFNYLVRKYDTEHKFSFTDPFDIARCDQWISFGIGDLGPNQSASIQFTHYIPERHPFSIQKYISQTEKCYSVLDIGLEGRDYLVGAGKGKYSIADIANFTFVNMSMVTGIGDLGRWKNLEEWAGRIWKREAVVRGTQIPIQVEGLSNESFKAILEKDPEAKKKYEATREEIQGWQAKYARP